MARPGLFTTRLTGWTVPGRQALAWWQTRPELMYQTMGAWHGNNGVVLGNPRLVYVQTQLVAWGDACDAGYFYEEDYDVAPEKSYAASPRRRFTC